jgi:hypothetical protein
MGRLASAMNEPSLRSTVKPGLRANRRAPDLGFRNLSSPECAGPGFAARRAAASVALLNRWRGMLGRVKGRRSSGSISKSASIKISTVSSLEIDLDTNGRVAEVNLVASLVPTSNYSGDCDDRPSPKFCRRYRHDRVVPGASRKRCMKTRSSQRPNLWPTSLK